MSNLIFIKDNDNNVGIGSNIINDIKGNINITQNLNVVGNINLTNGLIKTTGIGSFGSIVTQGNIEPSVDNIHNLGSDTQRFANSYVNQGLFTTLKTTGNVGIGSANPTKMLDVNGELYVKGDATLGHNTLNVVKQNSGWHRVGVNKTGPEFPLHVNGTRSSGSATYTYITTLETYDTAAATSSVSAKFEGRIWMTDVIYHSSDSRIKTNIVDVPDNLALQQLRSIPCRYYEYIDKVERGTEQTIGFIAQEVKSVFPMAVSEQKQIIPNVYKIINCTWTSVDDKFIMNSSDLSNVSDVKYKFYVSNATDASDEKEIILTGNSDNTFTFDTQYTNVFCYGSEVDDFHTLDKTKLFTLNFSVTQEIDRIQQTHITEIASLKAENKN